MGVIVVKCPVTGRFLRPLLDGKRQDLLIEAVPGVRRIATLVNSGRTKQEHVQQLLVCRTRARRRDISFG